MCVIKREIPSDSIIYSRVNTATYSDAYEMCLEKENLSIVEIYQALAAATPQWVNGLMILRDKMTSVFKLNPVGALGKSTGDTTKIIMPKVGEKLDAFTLWFINENEIVVGEDDKHLDFRLSIKKQINNSKISVILSMVVFVHNTLGHSYLFCVLPFHKIIMRKFLNNARKLGYL